MNFLNAAALMRSDLARDRESLKSVWGAHAPRVLLGAPRPKLAPNAFTTLSVPLTPNPTARRRREHAGARVLPGSCEIFASAPSFRSLLVCVMLSVCLDFPLFAQVQPQIQPTLQAQPEGRIAAVNGVQMYYETYGEGRPLVLLHGYKASSQVWKPFIADLAKQHSLIVPDLRGHGRSTNPAKQFTHKQCAADIFALLDHLKINQCSAIGISSGAMTLLHMATQRPDRIDAMILIGATTYFPAEARAIIGQTTLEAMTQEEWQAARQIHKLGDEQIRELVRGFQSFKENVTDMNFTPPYLASIKARTLIIHGDRDSFFPVSIAVEMYRAIPQAFLWVVPNGGHVPIFGEPASFLKTSMEFLQSEK